MKKFPVITIVAVGLLFAGLAEAAPKKRTRNQNRIGPYAGAMVGQTTYTEDQSNNEQTLLDILEGNNIPLDTASVKTDDSDIGYQLAFGYRFHRYFAAEIALAQYGELSTKATGQLDSGSGPQPASADFTFNAQGPVFSALGILPLGEQFEVYGRVGYLIANSERRFSLRVNGQSGGSLSAKGDSQHVVYGLGLAWNLNQVYTIRAEFQQLDNVGQSGRTGTEDMDLIQVGLMMRF
jgi:hypothetical protein